jgi:hypothetical protein
MQNIFEVHAMVAGCAPTSPLLQFNINFRRPKEYSNFITIVNHGGKKVVVIVNQAKIFELTWEMLVNLLRSIMCSSLTLEMWKFL